MASIHPMLVEVFTMTGCCFVLFSLW